jgi:hypothetical protein
MFMAKRTSRARCLAAGCVIFTFMALGTRQAHAQGRDSLLNGTVIGAAVGAASGVALVHATSDSELGFTQYAQGALIFGAMGAGIGVGIDALLDRAAGPGAKPRPVSITPAIWRRVGGVVVNWRW